MTAWVDDIRVSPRTVANHAVCANDDVRTEQAVAADFDRRVLRAKATCEVLTQHDPQPHLR